MHSVSKILKIIALELALLETMAYKTGISRKLLSEWWCDRPFLLQETVLEILSFVTTMSA